MAMRMKEWLPIRGALAHTATTVEVRTTRFGSCPRARTRSPATPPTGLPDTVRLAAGMHREAGPEQHTLAHDRHGRGEHHA